MTGPSVRPFVLALDLIGTTVFAVEGATAAIRGGLDLFGVLVLAFVTAFGGGILRDLLIGDAPPIAIRDYRYALLAFAGGMVTFLFYDQVQQAPPLLVTGRGNGALQGNLLLLHRPGVEAERIGDSTGTLAI